MCGRYFIDMAALGALEAKPAESDRANDAIREMCPGREAIVLRMKDRAVCRESMTWGFDNQSGRPVINARVETMRQKPLFSALADSQRCAIPASGYYEWRRSDHQRYAVSVKGVNPLYLAGLYRMGERGMEFVVLTQAPIEAIRPFHDRMPVILRDNKALTDWLSGKSEPGAASDSGIEIRATGDEQLRMPF